MGGFSALAPFGLLTFGDAPSRAEQIYAAKVSALTDPQTGMTALDLTPGSHEEAVVFADAIVEAAAAQALDRASQQGSPLWAEEGLPDLEVRYGVVPGPQDDLPTRQAAVAAAKKAPRGARPEAVEDALRTLLGEGFLALRECRGVERRVVPANPRTSGNVNAQRVDVPPKTVRLLEPVAHRGVLLWTPYASLDGTDVALTAGERVMVQPENTGVAEVLAVADVRRVNGVREFQAAFVRAHDEGALVTTTNWPIQTSTARFTMVVVTSAVARSPELRARIHALMARVARAVTTWAIVEPRDAQTRALGPFVPPAPLGAVPLGALTYP